jgi:hypothetical protein
MFLMDVPAVYPVAAWSLRQASEMDEAQRGSPAAELGEHYTLRWVPGLDDGQEVKITAGQDNH